LPHKKGHIQHNESKILDKLGIDVDIWLKSYQQYSEHSYSHIGSPDQLKAVCEQTEKKWLAGTKVCRELYVS